VKKYAAEDIRHALSDVDIEKSDVVMMHSSLLSLGRFVSSDSSNVPVAILSAIIKYLGADGTLIMPAFNFDFCKGVPFDRQRTPAKGMGVLAERLRRWPGARRSPHPMQSVVAIGKYAQEICQLDTPSAFSIGGPFHWLLEGNAKLLLFGCSLHAASFIHYAEERCAVPYRYWKAFQGEYIDLGKNEIRQYQMFVRYLDLNPVVKPERVQPQMLQQGTLKVTSLGGGRIYACSFSDYYETACNMLEEDPFCLLTNKDEVIQGLARKGIQ